MKHYLLLLLTTALLPALAPAQVKIGLEGQPYPLHSPVNAGADAAYTLQWYRNGVAIPGCTGQTCTVPADLATGTNVRFARRVTAQNCLENEGWSNEVIVTFKCGNGYGTRIGTVCWADRNVDAAGAFTATPDAYGRYYQWNRNRGWTASEAAVGWVTSITDPSWTVNPLPCPTGWRLPTKAEYQALDQASGGSGAAGDNVNTNGGTWVAAGAKGNVVAGRFYGPNHTTCRLDGSMAGCVFLPASGYRNIGDGTLTNQGNYGSYWSSTQYNSGYGYYLFFGSGNSNPSYANGKTFGFSVRCVQ